MSSLHLISTGNVKPFERVVLYRDALRELFGGLESRIDKNSQFSAEIEYASVGDISLCRYTASAHQVERTKTFARRDEKGSMKVAFQLKE